MILHYHITVTGKVQGVWYRKSTQEKALHLGVKGFVKNLSNGNVYIEAEGNLDQLKKLVNWCKVGPEFAIVQEVTFLESKVKHFTNFEVVYKT